MANRSRGEYYSQHLSAERLRRCYEVAPPRVQQYLQAEIQFVARHIKPDDTVLELGCGYGRVPASLAGRAGWVVGIDNSVESLIWGAGTAAGCLLAAMDASRLGFTACAFDAVFCIQNGIAVFSVDRQSVFDEAVRVTRPGGRVLFSSYSERFWPERLEWFRIQAAQGLLGDIDEAATGDGVIVCKDGFRADTVGRDEFDRLAAGAGCACEHTEVDGSSLFCILRVP